MFDNMTRGQQKNMDHNIRELGRYADFFMDALETVRKTAPAIAVGIEEQFTVVPEILKTIETRWRHFQLNGEWPSATAKATANQESPSVPEPKPKLIGKTS